ncbi:Motile Sperm domain containing protein [Trichuris trichiura]|uniref:Major sperm protein n=1 Tax=Trichuris trichiura TaxID=36087 RepID=A0A077YZJ4_TRITR|nr:Motile Sperm domain containing protein [Trichuris trichiura]
MSFGRRDVSLQANNLFQAKIQPVSTACRKTKIMGGSGRHRKDESPKGLKKRSKEKRDDSEPHIIQVDPTELFIAGAYFFQRLNCLTVTNQSNERIAYKIKITHPENYIVKPSIGFLDPKESVLIRVLLNEYTTETFKEKHYLQLLALPIGLEKPASKDKFWKEMEKSKANISCMYLPILFKQKSVRKREDEQTKYVLRTLEKICDQKEKSKKKSEEEAQAVTAIPTVTPTVTPSGTSSIAEKDFQDVRPSEQVSFLHDFLHYVDLYPEVIIYILCFVLLLIVITK